MMKFWLFFSVMALNICGHSRAVANEAPAAPAATSVAPWAEVQSRMLGYKGQRNQLLATMKKLKEEQAHLPLGSQAMKQKSAEIVKAYKEYKDATEEYNRLLVILKYRYPERLAKEALQVNHAEEVPPLEQLEADLDLDGRLNRGLNKARQQYGSSPSTEGRQPSSVGPTADEEIKTIREQDPILLSK